MAMLPEKREDTSRPSIEVTRTYLHRGGVATRGLWVKVAPQNPLLKVLMIPPFVVMTAALLVLLLVILGFILLAALLMAALPKGKKEGAGKA